MNLFIVCDFDSVILQAVRIYTAIYLLIDLPSHWLLIGLHSGLLYYTRSLSTFLDTSHLY